MKQIHYSKINFTFLGFFFFFPQTLWPIENLQRKHFIAPKRLDSSIIWIATTDDAPVIMTKTSNQLQGLLKKFLHNNKFVVGIVALASSTNLQIYLNKVKFERNQVTKSQPNKHRVLFSKKTSLGMTYNVSFISQQVGLKLGFKLTSCLAFLCY